MAWAQLGAARLVQEAGGGLRLPSGNSLGHWDTVSAALWGKTTAKALYMPSIITLTLHPACLTWQACGCSQGRASCPFSNDTIHIGLCVLFQHPWLPPVPEWSCVKHADNFITSLMAALRESAQGYPVRFKSVPEQPFPAAAKQKLFQQSCILLFFVRNPYFSEQLSCCSWGLAGGTTHKYLQPHWI